MSVDFRDLTKSQRRAIRDLAALAHTRELSAELTRLESAFARWRASEIDPHELSNLIHAFHQGSSRKLFVAYSDSAPTLPVASAIARGIISESEVPEHVRDFLGPAISFFHNHIGSDSDVDDSDATP